MKNENGIEDSDLDEVYGKNPSLFVVPPEEFAQLKAENDEDVIGCTYEEYCEVEHEGWVDVVKAVLHKPFESLDAVPRQRFWRNGVKPMKESVEFTSSSNDFEKEFIADDDCDEST